MKTFLTKAEFTKIIDDLFYEGYFATSMLLNINLEEMFKQEFTYAVVIEVEQSLLVIQKRENSSNTYEVYSMK